MKILIGILLFIAVLLTLSIIEVRHEAKKNGRTLGVFGSLWRGILNLFGHIFSSVSLDF